MKVKIKETKLSENTYCINVDKYQHSWDVTNLIQYCKEKEYEVFDLPLVGIDISIKVWDVNSIQSFISHSKRVKDVDMSKPIILDDTGFICDGWHRVIKAIVNGDKIIKAIRIEEMPEPSGKTLIEKI